MAQPQVAQGGIIHVHELDRKTWKIINKSLLRIYTDAIADDGTVPDQQAFMDAVGEADRQTKGQVIDGYDEGAHGS